MSSSTPSSPSPIKLAILDDYANIAPGHFRQLSQTTSGVQLEIESFPETLHARLPVEHDALIQRLKPFTVISSMRERTQFPRSILSQLPNLKLLLTTGGRNAAIDTAACKELGIRVIGTGHKANAVPGYDSTNEQTWALILGLTRNLVQGDTRLKRTRDAWQVDPPVDEADEAEAEAEVEGEVEVGGNIAAEERFNPALVSALAGKTLGLLGLGRLGTQAAVTGKLGFGMKILAWSSSLTQGKADEAAQSRGLPAGSFEVAASKEDLFRRADVLSVHYVLSDRSRGIVGKKELSVMKPTAYLVNTSRGPLVQEPDLLEVLEKGGIRGVGLDVFDTEPLPGTSPFRREKFWGRQGRSRVLLSPHLGYADEETMHAWYAQQAEVLGSWINGGDVKGGIVIV